MSAVTNAAMPGIEEIRTMGERNVIKAALLGAGTVGSGVYALAEMLKDEMFQKTGASLEIKKVLVRNTKKDRPGIPKEIMTDNWHRPPFFRPEGEAPPFMEGRPPFMYSAFP